ncbi:MAG TPA: sugar ABC transporter permease, partial [Acetobacteraceae bacterium]|nr:sugar ABC transporter permease [Acetobacteraceae bacterium]
PALRVWSLAAISDTRAWPWLLLAPTLILIAAVVLYPTIRGIDFSFHQMRLNRPALGFGYIGLANYAALLNDPVFWGALGNTAIWVGVTVLLELTLGLAAAIALDMELPGSRAIAVIVLLPWFLPVVVAGNIWALMLDSRLGIINAVLTGVGVLDSYKAWFADPNWALPAAILVEAWHGFPFFALLLLAGLKGVPQELYEAAAVDGATFFHRLVHIQLPSLRMIIVAVVVLRAIALVNAPDLLLILTDGGPGRSSEVLSLYAFQKAYREFNFGYAGALSVVMFVLLMFCSWLYVKRSAVLKE